MNALEGLRVLEATDGIAGGYAGKLLRDQGAHVVKLDVDTRLQHWSAATPDVPVEGTGALGAFLDAGKDIVAVVDTADGFDAVIREGAVGVDVDPTSATVVRIEPFGIDGPLAGVPASEFTLQAWCGLMSGCGTLQTPPLQMGILHGQWAAGAVAAMAALAGVRSARAAGVAPTIEVSALEVMAVVLCNYPPLYRQFTGSVSFMSRSGDWPQVVPCQDGWIGLCVFTPQQWSDFAAMIGREDLSADDRLNSMGGRGRNRALAESVVRPWLETHTVAEICELGELFRVPVAQVGNGRDVLAMDHFVERGVFVEHPDGFLAPRPPFLSTTSPAPTARSAAPAPALATGPLPLSGVTVLDLTAFWAGPACTHQLATLGADVIKVESPFRPDGMRFATVRPPTEPDWMEYGPTFHGTNPGKRSITIDFSKPEGRELVLRLVERADVVVENFTPRVLGNVGLEYDDLVARRADVILLRMPAFGLDGPWRDRPGFAETTEQVSGIAWMTGEAGGEALVRSTIDPIAGIHGAFAVLAALAHREHTGEGQQIEMPMAEVAMNVAAEPIVTWSAYGTLLERDGDRGAPGAPQGVYACAGTEQWVALSITDDREWHALVTVLGDPEWARDPELATGAGRRARARRARRLALRVVRATRSRRHRRTAARRGGARRSGVGPDDPGRAAAARRARVHPVAGAPDRRARRLSGHRRARRHLRQLLPRPAPTVGQHTAEVLHELGLSDVEIAALHDSGVI